jgi:hypothetical protein
MLTEIITIYAISDDLLKAMGHREDPHYLATANAPAKAETKAEVIGVPNSHHLRCVSYQIPITFHLIDDSIGFPTSYLKGFA